MPDSPINPPSDPQNPENCNTQKRICDFCCESTALLYCRADSAKLCLACDREVHSTNPLFTKHTRFQLCDACDSASASILCFTEHSVLCQNCDFEIHNRQPNCTATAHDRRPLEGFSGCPSAPEVAAIVGFESFDAKCSGLGDEGEGFAGGFLSGVEEDSDGFSDFFWGAPAVVSIDELIHSTDKSHSFQAMVVPPLPKDKNLSCGQHKQEMLNQLHELRKSEPHVALDLDPLARLHNVADENEEDFRVQHLLRASQCDGDHGAGRGHEARSSTRGNGGGEAVNESPLSGGYVEESVLISDKHSSICSSANLATTRWNSDNYVGNEPWALPQKVATHEFNSADRDSALSRYKEKKRTRRYDKHIRYESRKVQAEHRIRIKGRFAKIDHRMNQA